MRSSYSPTQFDFAANWFFKILPLCKDGPIGEAFRGLEVIYADIAEYTFEETHANFIDHPHMLERAEEKLQLELHIGRVRCSEWHWIMESFEADQLVPLSLAIAEVLYPGKEWIIIGDGTEEAIVTDRDRTIVFDFKNFQKLSGAGSLAMAGDPFYRNAPAAMDEALQSREVKMQNEIDVLIGFKNLLNSEPETRRLSLVTNETSEEMN